jgi:hypothetical protein
MQPKIIVQVLLSAVVLTGAFALKSEAGFAQVSGKPQAFICDTSSRIPKTVSAQTKRPIFAWKNRQNPLKDCVSATNRLNTLVQRNGGSTRGLFLNAGLVNNQTVVCVGTVAQFGCNAGNTVVNITQGNQSSITNAGEIVQPLQDQIADLLSGDATIQSQGKQALPLDGF